MTTEVKQHPRPMPGRQHDPMVVWPVRCQSIGAAAILIPTHPTGELPFACESVRWSALLQTLGGEAAAYYCILFVSIAATH